MPYTMLTMKREGEQGLLCLILPPSILPQQIWLKTLITLRIWPDLQHLTADLRVNNMYLKDHNIFIFSLGAHVTCA